MNVKLKSELIEVFQNLADILSNIPLEHRNGPIQGELLELKGIIAKYSEEEVKTCGVALAAGDAFELYWLARVGVQGVKNHLIEALDSDDAIDVMRAALGLEYLGDSKGADTLRLLAKKAHKLSDQIDPEDELLEELKLTDLPNLNALRDEITEGSS